jgi:DNA-binding MarR family transcriptional regulator
MTSNRSVRRRWPYASAVPAEEELLDALEGMTFGMVGLTARALADAALAYPGRDNELTLAQWRVLVVLGDGPLRVGAVAGRIGSSLASASRLVTRMESRGFVRTARDERDRRATLVSLAPLGVDVRSRVVRRRRQLIRELVAEDSGLAGLCLEEGLAVLAERFSRFG